MNLVRNIRYGQAGRIDVTVVRARWVEIDVGMDFAKKPWVRQTYSNLLLGVTRKAQEKR